MNNLWQDVRYATRILFKSPALTTIALLFGIIFLMTIKPLLTSAIGAMLIAACLGVASALPFVHARGAGASERSNQHEGDSA